MNSIYKTKKFRLHVNILLLFVFSYPSVIKSQIGLEILGNKNTYKSWNEVIYDKYGFKDNDIFRYSYGGGINYWFGLTGYRLEFTPGFYYMYSSYRHPQPINDYQYITHTIGFEFDMNLYMFDFVRRTYKRDCPTFSHQGEWFRKSFFIQASPGVFLALRNIENAGDDTKDENFAGKFDIGLGLDMNISKHLIIAPVIKWGFYIGEQWSGFSAFHGEKSYNDITPGNYINLVMNFYLK